MRDLVDTDRVNSRMNKEQIWKYARPLGSVSGVTAARVETEPLTTAATAKQTRPRRNKPFRPEKARHITYEPEIATALGNLRNEKLSSLYHSITAIELEPHTPIICIGVWAFFETLTACAGRGGTSFDAFLSKARLASFGVTAGMTSVRSALGRVHEYGRETFTAIPRAARSNWASQRFS